jgi:hypothetical protein
LRIFIAVSVCALLAGCGHNLMLMSREGSTTGQGVAHGSGGKGELTIDLEGKHYTGRWVAFSGGSLGLLQTYGAHPVTGTAISTNAQSTGNALLKAEDGSGLRCEFQFSGWTNTGIGVCQADGGRLYDLQIN